MHVPNTVRRRRNKTTPDEPRAAAEDRIGEAGTQEQIWERLRSVDRDWSPERATDRPSTGPTRVLVPFDDSAVARDALEYSFEQFPNADVTALLIVSDSTIAYIPSPSDGSHAGAASDLLAARPTELDQAIQIAERCDGHVRTAGRVGSPVRGILEYLERESVDHVVIGSHCRTGLGRVLRGSVAEVVVRHSPVPVTVIPASSERERGD